MSHKHPELSCVCLNAGRDIPLYHIGPPLDLGPLPSIFYFALSGKDSLTLDPFNQPVQFLQGKMVRIFSMDLPAHELGLSPNEALKTWAEDFAKGVDPLSPFFEKVKRAIDFVIEKQFASPHKLACMGLSRGGFVAAHIASQDERIEHILFFASLTKLQFAKDFAHIQNSSHVLALDVDHLVDKLYRKKLRFYIGNRDERVSTRHCFEFAMQIVDQAKEKGIRASFIEFIMTPSIGHLGHGTSLETFQNGAAWLLDHLTK